MRRKAASKRIQNGFPVHSFRSLLADVATIIRNARRWRKALTPGSHCPAQLPS